MPVDTEVRQAVPAKEAAGKPPLPASEIGKTPDKVGPAKKFAGWLKGRLNQQVSVKDIITGKAQKEALTQLVKGPDKAVSPGEKAAQEGAATAAAAEAAGVGSLENVVPGDLNAGAEKLVKDATAAEPIKPLTARDIRRSVRAAAEDHGMAQLHSNDSKTAKIVKSIDRVLNPIKSWRRNKKLDRFNPYDALKPQNNAPQETPGQGAGPSSTK